MNRIIRTSKTLEEPVQFFFYFHYPTALNNERFPDREALPMAYMENFELVLQDSLFQGTAGCIANSPSRVMTAIAGNAGSVTLYNFDQSTNDITIGNNAEIDQTAVCWIQHDNGCAYTVLPTMGLAPFPLW